MHNEDSPVPHESLLGALQPVLHLALLQILCQALDRDGHVHTYVGLVTVGKLKFCMRLCNTIYKKLLPDNMYFKDLYAVYGLLSSSKACMQAVKDLYAVSLPAPY
jgi:hypothetical protein